MTRPLLFTLILIIGVFISVAVIQNSTLLRSKAYFLVDFIPSFHATENDPRYNRSLDVYKDGIINVFDVLKDRYLQESTNSATPSAEVSRSAEATSSATQSANLK